MAKAEEAASCWRSTIAMTAANKYQIITLNHYLNYKKGTKTEQEKMAFFQSAQGRVPRQINVVGRGQQLMYNAM